MAVNHGVGVSVRVGVSQNNSFLLVFKSLYLSNLWMDLVDTLLDVRYWPEVLCYTCIIMTHISDLEVKVMDFEIFY